MLSLLLARPSSLPPIRLRLSGELDLAAAPELERQLRKLDGDISIDCAGLTFIDLCGLRPLFSAHWRCIDRGTRLVLVDPPPCLTRLLMLTDLGTVFELQTGEK